MKLSVDKKVILAFIFALIMLSVIGITSYSSVVQLRENTEWVKRSQQIIVRLESVFSTVSDIAAGARGYAITGDDDYLGIYYSEKHNGGLDTGSLRELIVDPSQRQRLAVLEQLITDRIEVINQIIDLQREPRFPVGKPQLLTGKGKVLQDRIRELIDAMITREQVLLGELEQRVNRSAGIAITVIIVGSLLSFVIVGLSMFFIQRDMTERKRAELALQESNAALQRQAAELDSARERAESADRIKSAFLATMSHELRTPLNSIIGFTGIILREMAGPLNAEQKKQLGMVKSSARHLLALINDVLDISKIEADQLVLHPEPFDLRTSISSVTDAVRPLAEDKGLALEVEVSPEVGEMVSDRRRVEQVLLNLLSNAVKFTESGGVVLRACLTQNDALASAGAAVRLTVTDTGIGIKAADLDSMFLPFSQIDSGLSRIYEGTGLGLAISRKIIEKLGGSINVSSVWEQGSVFTVVLPVNGRAS